MANQLSQKDRLKEHPMFDHLDYCDECNGVILTEEETFEYGENFICKRCWERHLDEAECYLADER